MFWGHSRGNYNNQSFLKSGLVHGAFEGVSDQLIFFNNLWEILNEELFQ